MASERQENSPDNPWWGEHVQRYELVSTYVPANARILDIACGSGFGSHLLAEKGFDVTGADLSQETVNACESGFKHPSLRFIQADATALPFANQHFDAIVSFETIEHTTQYKKVLEEFKRVLKPQGIILISTPNIKVNSPDGIVRNPYHTQEWNYEELSTLLSEAYSKIQLYGQEYQRYKNKNGIRSHLARITERFFYLRGVRKLPLKLQNLFIQALIQKPMYPVVADYGLVEAYSEIITCKTFLAVCRP